MTWPHGTSDLRAPSDLHLDRPSSPGHPEVTVTVRPFPILLALTAGLLLGGCSAGQGDSSSEAAAPAAAGAKVAAGGSADSGSADSGTAKSSPQVRTDVAAAGTRRVRTAQLTIEVRQLPTAAARIRAAAQSLGGVVSTENSNFGPLPNEDSSPQGQSESVITVRVPEPQLETALSRIAAVGHELDRSTSSQDVTASIADLNSRVSSQTRSVARIRDLMNRADSLQDVVLLESELSKREADLESIQAQQRVLSDQADLATITVTLRTPNSVVAAAKDDDGFLAGLRQGWHAVAASTTVVLTVLGALLPVAVVLVLLGWPGYLLFRRLRPRATTPGATTPGATT
jgi:hypothetical protein